MAALYLEVADRTVRFLTLVRHQVLDLDCVSAPAQAVDLLRPDLAATDPVQRHYELVAVFRERKRLIGCRE